MPLKNRKKCASVAIVGLGLLGSSLGKALKDKGYRRLGWTRKKAFRKKAVSEDIVDECPDSLNDILARSDITVLCLPIPQIIAYAISRAAFFKKGSVVTDIGSVKEIICRTLVPELKKYGVEFIGSHPMAGTEKSGMDAAFRELYDSASVFITPDDNAPPKAVAAIKKLWESINTRTVRISPKEHDLLVASSSHLPHIVSMALTHAVLGCEDKTRKMRYAACAGGFKDTSRISSSSPLMWREIIQHNRRPVLNAMRDFEKRLKNIREHIEAENYDALQQKFALGKKLRDDWIKSGKA